MKTISFSVHINASKEIVWEQLWSDAGYRNWTTAFCEGSYATSDWNEGSKIVFLSPSGDGMYGIIQKKIDLEQMTFEHHGEVKNGEEIPQVWAGAKESYHLKETENGTEVTVLLDTNGDFEKYFNETFPKALNSLKIAAEAQAVNA